MPRAVLPTDVTTFPKASQVLTDLLARKTSAEVIVTVQAEDGPAAAWFDHDAHAVTVSLAASKITVELDDLDGTDRAVSTAFNNPESLESRKLRGLVFHEASHSVHSHWMLEEEVLETSKEPGIFPTLELFEEIRIEKRALDQWGCRKALRDTVDALIIADVKMEEITTRSAVARLWLLTAGRSFASVITKEEALPMMEAADTVLGGDTEYLEEILAEAVETDCEMADGRLRMIELARAWIDIVGLDPADEGAGCMAAAMGDAAADGEETDGEGEGTGEDEDKAGSASTLGNEVSDEDREVLEQALTKVREDFDPSAIPQTQTRRADPQVMAAIFSKTQPAPNWTHRPPTADERKKAAQLAGAFRSISYHAPEVSLVPSLVPPGRLKTREAVAASAERARGAMVTAQPWQRKKRHHQPNPPLTIGLATDTSGSMSWASELVASTAFIMGHATNAIGGRFAAVTFGDRAEYVIRPREVPDQVHIRRANGGDEACDDAVAALDGVLHLRDGKGARLLILVTDYELVRDGERGRMAKWWTELQAAGVGVVILNQAYVRHSLPKWIETGVISHTTGVEVISQTAERALRQANAVA